MKVPLIILLIGTAMASVCTGTTDSSSSNEAPEALYHKISAEQAKSIMDAGDPYILLDVRTEEEFTGKHIAGALLVPHTEIAERAAADLPDTDAVILVYCRSGRRSEEAARALVDLGYSNIYDFGGITDWPYDTVGE